MKSISVTSQKDEGDFLVIVDQPWYAYWLETFMGVYNPRWDWDHRIWSAVIVWCSSKNKQLLRLQVEHSCATAEALWGKDDVGCFHGSDGGHPAG